MKTFSDLLNIEFPEAPPDYDRLYRVSKAPSRDILIVRPSGGIMRDRFILLPNYPEQHDMKSGCLLLRVKSLGHIDTYLYTREYLSTRYGYLDVGDKATAFHALYDRPRAYVSFNDEAGLSLVDIINSDTIIEPTGLILSRQWTLVTMEISYCYISRESGE